MILKELHSEFEIDKRVPIPKTNFEGPEMFPAVSSNFSCLNCGAKLQIELEPFKSGWPLEKIYKQRPLIEMRKLIKNGVAKEPARWQNHLTGLVVSSLPALYSLIECQSCSYPYLIVFGSGETQPGRMQFKISGVWSIKLT